MSLFGKIVKTVVNVVELPLAVVKDATTLGGVCTGEDQTYTRQQIEKIKEEADE